MPSCVRLRAYTLVASALWLASLGVHAEHVDVAPLSPEIINAVVNTPLSEKATVLLQTDAMLRQAREQLASHLTQNAGPRRERSITLGAARGELQALEANLAAVRADIAKSRASEVARRRITQEVAQLETAVRSAAQSGTSNKMRAELKNVVRLLDRYITANNDQDAPVPLGQPTNSQRLEYLDVPFRKAVDLPEYAKEQREDGKVLVAALGTSLLAQTPPATPTQASVCAYTSADLATTAQEETNLTKYPEIKDLAASLNYDAAKIFEYVQNNIRFEPHYAGSLKGAGLTLQSKAGNDIDHASLLIALLRASKIPARYVHGAVEIADPSPKGKESRLNRWFGTEDYKATHVLARISSAGAAILLTNSNEEPVGVRFAHTWVQACLPYSAYRGNRIDNSGHRWIALDPSYKDIRYREGIPHNVKFDEDGYLLKRHNGPDSLPHEYYAEQVEAGIRQISQLNSIDRVPRSGSQVKRSMDVLPATLPFAVTSFIVFDNTTQKAESAVVPDIWRNRLQLTVRDPAGTTQLAAKELIFPETLGKRVTLSFKGIDSTHQARLDSWRVNADLNSVEPTCTGATPTKVRPSIRVDGTEVAVGAASPGVSFCANNVRLEMNVTLPKISCTKDGVTTSIGCVNSASFQNISGANIYAMIFWGYAGSNDQIQSRVGRLLQNIRSAGTNPNDPGDIDPVQGEFLNVVGLKYGRYSSDATQRIAALTGKVGADGMSLGVVATVSKVGFMFDQPFAIHRKGFLIDVPGGQTIILDPKLGTTALDEFFLAGRVGSALESYVWQENARLDAVSTIRGLQFANESAGTSNDNSILKIDKLNWSVESPKLQYSAEKIEVIRKLVFDDDALVRVPKRPIQYDSTWSGIVYLAESTLKKYGRYVITEGLNGGFAKNLPVSTRYNSNLGTGYSFSRFEIPPSTYELTYAVSTAPKSVNSHVSTGDAKGNTHFGDPVNMVTGNMYHNETDFQLPLRGTLKIVFQRAYNSGNSDTDGPLGFGWTHSFNHYLTFVDEDFNGTTEAGDSNGITSGVVWTDGTGAERQIGVTGTTAAGIPVSSTSFSSPVGYRFIAKRLGNGNYEIAEKDGLIYRFESVSGTVGQKAVLREIVDPQGNALTLTYDTLAGGARRLASVTDGSKQIVFGYSGATATKIQSVTDWTGRSFEYEYDALGDLRKMWRPGVQTSSTPSMTYDYYGATDGVNQAHRMKRFSPSVSGAMEFEYYTNGRTLRHRDANGGIVSFAYNEFRRETVAINERGHERRMFFDKNGMLIKHVLEDNTTEEFVYGNPDGNDRFNLKESVDKRGNKTSYLYDASDNLVQITHPSGRTEVRSHFTQRGQPGKIKDARGLYTLFKYDSKGNQVQSIRMRVGFGATVDPATYLPVAGEIAAWSINVFDQSNGNLLSSKRVRDFSTQEGPTIEYGYGAGGYYATSITRRGDKNGDGVIAASEFDTASLTVDSFGRVQVGVDDRWEGVTYGYDSQGRIGSITDSTGSKLETEYDSDGKPLLERISISLNGQVTQLRSTQYRYDPAGRLIQSSGSGGAISSFAYDASGNLVRRDDPDGRSVTYLYDAMQRPISVIDGEGNEETSDLDVLGRPLSVADAEGRSTHYEYWDSSRDGRLRRVTSPQVPGFAGGISTEYDYDEAGNPIHVQRIGANGSVRSSLTTYDELNRATRVVGPLVVDPVFGSIRPVRINVFDNLGNLVEVKAGRTDSVGSNPSADVVTRQAKYTFDDFGRLLREEDGAGRAWSFSYDRSGNVLMLTDPRGKITVNEWESGGRLKTSSNDAGTTIYVRDGFGAPIRVTSSNPSYVYEYQYDAYHRLVRIKDNRGDKQIEYEYSRGGRLLTMRTSEGAETNYQYDAVGRLTGIWAPNYDYFAFGYDRSGQLVEKWTPGGYLSRWRYNDDGTLNELQHTGPEGDLAAYQYAYDEWGNRNSVVSELSGRILISTYEYDGLDRLTRERQVSPGTFPNETLRNNEYRYDILGNIAKVIPVDAANYYQYNYDAGGRHQLGSISVHHSSGVQLYVEKSFSYDEAGNRTGLEQVGGIGHVYQWDENNRLKAYSMSIPAAGVTATSSYSYDFEGRRIEVRWTGSSSTQSSQTVTRYLYDGENIASEYGDSWDVPVASYTHGPSIDNPLVQQSGAGEKYFHVDGLGSVVILTNRGGAVQASRNYDAWGGPLMSNGGLFSFGYTGREDSSLMYYRARYYDVSTERFISRDPIGLSGGLNPYSYVGNNPVNFKDPTGLVPVGVREALNGWSSVVSQYYGRDANANVASNSAGMQLAYCVPCAASATTMTDVSLGVFAGSHQSRHDIASNATNRDPLASLPDSVQSERLTDKMAGEIERIADRMLGPLGEMYTLRATKTAPYRNVRGGTTNLEEGDIYKVGETTSPGQRYSREDLRRLGVRYQAEYRGSQTMAKIMEKIKIYGYFIENGELPPGNRIFR